MTKHFLFISSNYHGEIKLKEYNLSTFSKALDDMLLNTNDADKRFNIQAFMCWAEEAEPGDMRALESDWQTGYVFAMIDPEKTGWKMSGGRN